MLDEIETVPVSFVAQKVQRLANFYEGAMREIGLTDEEIRKVKIGVALRQIDDMEQK